MISNDAIHVQAERGKNCNVGNINTPEANDYLWRCTMFSDVLNLLLLHISDDSWDKEHTDDTDGMDESLM